MKDSKIDKKTAKLRMTSEKFERRPGHLTRIRKLFNYFTQVFCTLLLKLYKYTLISLLHHFSSDRHGPIRHLTFISTFYYVFKTQQLVFNTHSTESFTFFHITGSYQFLESLLMARSRPIYSMRKVLKR